MLGYFLEWSSLLLRWLHVVAAMAWIGASLFFMHLDASLRKTPGSGADGVNWQVHSGGFYEMRKYLVAPDGMPQDLVWHKWQAYTTWLSGFLLLTCVYYAQSSLYLVSPSVMRLEGWEAAGIGVTALAAGWIVYDLLCRSRLGKNELVLTLSGFAFIVLGSLGFSSVFSGRGALVHTGALMATWMAGNVFFVIIPNQRKVVASLLARETPDTSFGQQAKQRSTHNNYLTLPVILLMLSSHYPVLYANSRSIPAIVALVTLAGALVRYFYNVRHGDHEKSPWWAWLGAAVVLSLAFWLAMSSFPAGREFLRSADVDRTNVDSRGAPEKVVEVVSTRCSMCHSDTPVWEGVHIAPKGVKFDSRSEIEALATAIRLEVATRAMPPNNLTEMTDQERLVVSEWGTPPR